jgi:outer membrane protein assembly factor BamE
MILPFSPALRPASPMRSALLPVAVLIPLALGACARAPVPVPEIVKPYRITIQQGNYVTREMIEQLKPGMTKEQVRFILGTPLVTDIFHADRWDYVFFREVPGGRREQRNFAVIFENGRLARVIGDLLPAEPVQAGAKPAPQPQAAKPEAPKADSAKSEPGRAEAAAEPPGQGATQKPAAPEAPAAGNWRAASDAPAPDARPEAGAKAEEGASEQPRTEPAPAASAAEKPARGFFGRMLERIGF